MQWYEILLRLAIALFVGFIIGFEREHHHRPAGMKTHIMVCVGAAVVSLIQVEMVESTIRIIADNPAMADSMKTDLGRMSAQVISGIGFLGAGTIMVRKGSVKGLTTAATLWLTACIGLAIGMGYYMIVSQSVALVMLVLIFLRFLQKKKFKSNTLQLEIDFSTKKDGMDSVTGYCTARGIIINNIEFLQDEDDRQYKGIYTMQIPRTVEKNLLCHDLLREQYILRVSELTE